LLRRDELHEAERSERLELGEAEPAVLPCVEVDALQVAVERAMRVRRRFTERIPERNRADGVATRDGTAAALDLAVADRLPTDGGRGLDLLDRRAARRARHEVEQQRVRAGDARLGQQRPARSFLGVR